MTQDQLAELTQGTLSRSGIANIESGRQRLAIHQLYAIAEALGVHPAALLPPIENIREGVGKLPPEAKVRAWVEKQMRKEG